MFVNVEVAISLPPGLTVPTDAVVDSGLSKRVYVETSAGHFEAREVETGWRLNDRVQIVKGLREGETIVAASTFLVDSESRLQVAANSASTSRDASPAKTATDHPMAMEHPMAMDHAMDMGHQMDAKHPMAMDHPMN